MKPATLLPILLTIAPLVVKGFSYLDDDFEDFALREYEDDYLEAREELIQEFTTRELIEELEDRLQARQDPPPPVPDPAPGAAPPADGAEGAGGPPVGKKLKKHHKKKHHKKKHHKKHGHHGGKPYQHGKKGKKKGGKKHHRKPLGAGAPDVSAYQSPPLVAPPAGN